MKINSLDPTTLDECMNSLDQIFRDEDKVRIKGLSENEFALSSHFDIGTWIRNKWIRQGDNQLAHYFFELGIRHLDDMSSIILHSYYRYLNHQDIDIKSQIDYYKGYYKVATPPSKEDYPVGVSDLRFNLQISCQSDIVGDCLHVGISETDKSIWLYHNYYGWKEIKELTLRGIQNNAPLEEEFLMNVYLDKENKIK